MAKRKGSSFSFGGRSIPRPVSQMTKRDRVDICEASTVSIFSSELLSKSPFIEFGIKVDGRPLTIFYHSHDLAQSAVLKLNPLVSFVDSDLRLDIVSSDRSLILSASTAEIISFSSFDPQSGDRSRLFTVSLSSGDSLTRLFSSYNSARSFVFRINPAIVFIASDSSSDFTPCSDIL